MIYFDARDDLLYIENLLAIFEKIIATEHQVKDMLRKQGAQYLGPYDMFKCIREESSKFNPEYMQMRASYAQMIQRANSICQRENVAWHLKGQAAPLEGGLPFQGSIFELALNRPSDLMDIDTNLRDTANQVIGAIQERLSRERREFFNPLYWISGCVSIFRGGRALIKRFAMFEFTPGIWLWRFRFWAVLNRVGSRGNHS